MGIFEGLDLVICEGKEGEGIKMEDLVVLFGFPFTPIASSLWWIGF